MSAHAMHMVLRCDASVEIGSGHVMRCLTLADTVAEGGGRADFLCRDLPGHPMAHIAARGHGITALPAPAGGGPDPGLYGAWLGVPKASDAAICRDHVEALAPDWVVVDHYALDGDWVRRAVPPGTRVMVIDDLADRAHVCDVLLDQNLGRKASDYDGLLPEGARRLIGPHFALLRPDFAGARARALTRRQAGAGLRHIMIAMGGMDRDDATGQVLEAIAGCPLPGDCRLSVVMGSQAPHLDAVRERAAAMPVKTRVLVDVGDMASLMADADLAVGGAGGTSWERCCLGLPTLVLIMADNQAPAAKALAASGAAWLLGDLRQPGWPDILAEALSQCGRGACLTELSRHAAALVDGRGAGRCFEALLARRHA